MNVQQEDHALGTPERRLKSNVTQLTSQMLHLTSILCEVCYKFPEGSLVSQTLVPGEKGNYG